MKLYKNGDCISLTDENFIAGYKANGWVETPPVAPVEEEIIDLGLIEDEPINEPIVDPVKEEKTEVVEPKKASAPKKTTSKKSGSKKAKK